MSLSPFNGADPSNIVAAFSRDRSPDEFIVIEFQSAARSSWEGRDDWQLLQQVLSHPSVYAAFGITSLPSHFQFNTAQGLEAIGTLANLLNCGGIHRPFVDDFEIALAEARRYLDGFFHRRYDASARAYSSHGAWCSWFAGEGILDETVLINHGNEWALFAVTGVD